MIKLQNLAILLVSILPLIISQELVNCDRSCPGGEFNQVPYPFGFSSGCEIRINCTSNGTVLIGEFPIQQFNSDDLLVRVPIKCGRPIDTIRDLYREHYAPLSPSAVIMDNCTNQVTNCTLPVPITQFRSTLVPNCGDDLSVYMNTSCYSGDITRMFLDYFFVAKMGCRFLLTGFVSEGSGDVLVPPKDIQAVKLGWWVKGACNCSDGADCTEIVSPFDGSDGHRCKCKSGFDGDGYNTSSGCQQVKGMPSIGQRF